MLIKNSSHVSYASLSKTFPNMSLDSFLGQIDVCVLSFLTSHLEEVFLLWPVLSSATGFLTLCQLWTPVVPGEV